MHIDPRQSLAEPRKSERLVRLPRGRLPPRGTAAAWHWYDKRPQKAPGFPSEKLLASGLAARALQGVHRDRLAPLCAEPQGSVPRGTSGLSPCSGCPQRCPPAAAGVLSPTCRPSPAADGGARAAAHTAVLFTRFPSSVCHPAQARDLQNISIKMPEGHVEFFAAILCIHPC